MINVAVEKLLEDFDEIIGLCQENDEIITILKDGEPDLVLVSCNTYEKQKALLNMKERLLEIEEEQIRDAKTYAIEDLNKKYTKIYKSMKKHHKNIKKVY